MNNKWNRNNALWMLLYAVLYAIVTAVVCVTGSIHPIFFVCYQITVYCIIKIPKVADKNGESCISILEKIA